MTKTLTSAINIIKRINRSTALVIKLCMRNRMISTISTETWRETWICIETVLWLLDWQASVRSLPGYTACRTYTVRLIVFSAISHMSTTCLEKEHLLFFSAAFEEQSTNWNETLRQYRWDNNLSTGILGDGGGGHWLVRMEWRPAGWSLCLPLLIFPCTITSRSSVLALAHPGCPEKEP